MITSLFTLFKLGKAAHESYNHYQTRHNPPPRRPSTPFPATLRNNSNTMPAPNMLEKLDQHSHSGGAKGALVRIIWRFLQFVLALTVCGLYGVDLHAAAQQGAYADSKWVYAEVTAGLSCILTAAYLLPMVPSLRVALVADWIVWILWLTLFGIFGNMYISEKAEGDSGVTRMKHAVWVDLVNMLLWFISAAYATAYFFVQRRRMGMQARSEI